MDGIFNVNKPRGMTSHDVVNLVRRFSRQRRVGHAGTLDPMAEGVLVVCLGKATRVVEYLVDDRKAYRAQITLGISTDTYDAEGRITAETPVGDLSLPAVEAVLSTFRGQIKQTPPVYSALKRAGQPLYKLARSGVPITPEPRAVTIFRCDIVSWLPPVLIVDVACSKGTYIRSMAHDLGGLLGCGAHLSALVRLASGRFALDCASTVDELRTAFEEGKAADLAFPIDEALLDFDALVVAEERLRSIRDGVGWPRREGTAERAVGDNRPVRVYSVAGEVVAMADYEPRGRRWQPVKVF